jgi:hypothetical protein
MGMMLKGMETICEVWQRFKEYDEMQSKGYILFKNGKRDDFWAGHGD